VVMEFESGSSYGRRPDGKDTVRSGLVNSSCIATLETPHHVSCLCFASQIGVQYVLPSDWKQSSVTSRFRFNG
jgi:hypothetical protein